MNRFYAAADRESEMTDPAGRYAVMRAKDGALLARCKSEAWSCAITDALNLVDRIADQTAVMLTWPEES